MEQKESSKQVPNQQNRPVVRILKHRHFWLIASVLLVLIVGGAAGGFWFWKTHQPDAKTPTASEQQRTRDTLQGQQEVLQGYNDGSDLTKMALNANMAKSYAYIGECDNAWQSLAQAKKLAPTGTESDMQKVETYIEGYCPK
jgi:uncharacterized protein HemX